MNGTGKKDGGGYSEGNRDGLGENEQAAPKDQCGNAAHKPADQWEKNDGTPLVVRVESD